MRRKISQSRTWGFLAAFLTATALAPSIAQGDDRVWSLVGGQEFPAERAKNIWHVVTQDSWPDNISLQVEWYLPGAQPTSGPAVPYECPSASISSEDPSFKQQGKPVHVSSGSGNSRRYSFTASGVKTNKSISKTEVYIAELSCYYRKASQQKARVFRTEIRVDANATAFWDPGIAETEHCVEFLTPRDGGQVSLAGGNEVRVKNTGGYGLMFIKVERAAKFDTGVHGDLTLPEGYVYVSEWTTVYEGSYKLPKKGKILNVRMPFSGGIQGGYYQARAECLGGYGFSPSFSIQYRVGAGIAALKPLSRQAAGGVGTPAGKPAAQADPKALKVMSPDLSVKSIAVHPVPLKAGTSVNIEIAFENKGNKASAPDAKYKLTCAVLQGGPECPVPSGDRTIGKGIDPGQTGSVILLGAQPAVAGEYRVSVAVPPDQMGRPYSVTLKVAPVITGPRTQPPDKPPQVRPTPSSQPPPDDSKPKPRLVPR